MHKMLIIGGAGYIGSHLVKRLGLLGCSVNTLENLSSGHRDAVLCGDFIHGDIADRQLLDQLFRSKRFDTAIHLSAYK
jgi:UDP-glucose 4-epimerase